MIGQMAIAIAGFNSLGRSVTPIFLSMHHFLYRFSTSAKPEENPWIRGLNSFAKCTIEFRSYLCGGLKCPLKGFVL